MTDKLYLTPDEIGDVWSCQGCGSTVLGDQCFCGQLAPWVDQQEQSGMQDPWDGPIYQGCANCPPVERIAPMDMLIAVGFGMAVVTKDGQPVYQEHWDMDEADYWSTQDAENAALADPDHNWLIVLEAPLRGRTYQRHDAGQWILIESSPGFA